MKIGLSLPTMIAGADRATVVDWSRRIEADGYDAIGFGERIAYQNLELFSVLAAAAAVTERVRIESTVVVLPMHAAAWVAKQAATMDVISDGRYTLGVGVGGRREDYDALGRSFDRRFDRLDAQVAEIRRLWDGGVGGDGLDPIGPHPAPGAIPMLSGSLGPKSLARAARWADGIAGFELDPSPAALSATRGRIDAAWDDAGAERPPYRMTSFWFALGPDADARLRAYARRYLGVFGAEVADSMAELCSAAGDDAVRAAVDGARDAGYDEIQLVPTSTDIAELDRLSSLLDADLRS